MLTNMKQHENGLTVLAYTHGSTYGQKMLDNVNADAKATVHSVKELINSTNWLLMDKVEEHRTMVILLDFDMLQMSTKRLENFRDYAMGLREFCKRAKTSLVLIVPSYEGTHASFMGTRAFYPECLSFIGDSSWSEEDGVLTCYRHRGFNLSEIGQINLVT